MKMNKRGITLIELVVVLAIIAIGTMLVVPNMGAWLPNYRLRSGMREIVSVMRVANMKAVSTNVEYRVYFQTVESKFWLERGNQSDNSTNWVGTTDAGNAAKEGDFNSLPTGVTITTAQSFIEFNPNSTCSALNITLTNSKGRQAGITSVTSTGKVNWTY
jgi:prepilin-type N-terminal cleavage/methylation domain-containing protein